MCRRILWFIFVVGIVGGVVHAEEGKMSVVTYEAFGAVGDGKTDDFDAIVKAHAYANKNNLPVRVNDDATYYIGGKDQTAVIQTDTEFGKAQFLIDDRALENIRAHVFMARSSHKPVTLEGLESLRRSQAKIDVTLPGSSVVVVRDRNVMRYIRRGNNQDDGSPQTDMFLVDAQGNVDPNTPIIWDFAQVTQATAHPLDAVTLRISGGRFTTIANQAESKYNYHARGIAIRRSNVVVDGIEHRVTGEGEHGAPYVGFLHISDCANVTVKNSVFTGRRFYMTIGSAGRPVPMGSYDIGVNRVLNISFINCSQTNDIKDRTFWGIMGTNNNKNFLLENCTFSRFDAHQGVANASIRNSRLGHSGVRLIGHGTFLMENTTVYANELIGLRGDYGSTWHGDIIIRDCKFVPQGRRQGALQLIGGSNDGQHDFGYTCYMPTRITIENLHIDDADRGDDYRGPTIFANFNPAFTDDSYEQPFPYIVTREVVLRNVTTASGKPLRVSDNMHMFKNVLIQQ